jgi:hypothetical protein
MVCFKYIIVNTLHKGDNKYNNNNNNNMGGKLEEEYLRRMRLVLDKDLGAKNKIQAMESLAAAVLGYSFGMSNWHQELQNFQGKQGNC